MNFFKTKHTLFAVAVCTLLATTSCNKELEQIQEMPAPQPTGQTLNKLIENSDDTLFFELVKRGGQLALISDSSKNFTLFVPVKNGIKLALSQLAQQLGYPLPLPPTEPDSVFIKFIQNVVPPTIAGGVIQYHIVPQKMMASQIGTDFPNKMLPTLLNPRPDTSLLIGPVIRLAGFPTTRNGGWYNNVPIVGVDQSAYNGVIHRIATVAMPPTRTLWDRINEDAELTYLKAAILRADSGAAPNASLKVYLNGFGANFTVFAPVDTAFRKTLIGLLYLLQNRDTTFNPVVYSNAVSQASSPDVFTIDTLYKYLSAEVVKGVVVYHVLGKKTYTNNFTVQGDRGIPTLLNTDIDYRDHPGLEIKAIFNGPSPFPDSIKIKDVYNNSPAANIILSAPLTPEPFGKSDQNYTNGVLHKIDRVLLPR